jgi:hypothetical protein
MRVTRPDYSEPVILPDGRTDPVANIVVSDFDADGDANNKPFGAPDAIAGPHPDPHSYLIPHCAADDSLTNGLSVGIALRGAHANTHGHSYRHANGDALRIPKPRTLSRTNLDAFWCAQFRPVSWTNGGTVGVSERHPIY